MAVVVVVFPRKATRFTRRALPTLLDRILCKKNYNKLEHPTGHRPLFSGPKGDPFDWPIRYFNPSKPENGKGDIYAKFVLSSRKSIFVERMLHPGQEDSHHAQFQPKSVYTRHAATINRTQVPCKRKLQDKFNNNKRYVPGITVPCACRCPGDLWFQDGRSLVWPNNLAANH